MDPARVKRAKTRITSRVEARKFTKAPRGAQATMAMAKGTARCILMRP